MNMTTRYCPWCLRFCNARSYGNAAGSLPRITMPHRVIERMDRIKAKDSAKTHQRKHFYKGPVIVSCKRKEFNHHKGQTYSDFSPQNLASGGWKHRKSAGDYFTINAYDGNPALLSKDVSHTDFTSLGLGPNLVKGLEDNQITHPTNIQVLTIPSLLQGKNVLCAAETGSGKTLAFLLPMLQRIEQHKLSMREHDTCLNSPIGVILTPARELADQIYAVTRNLAPYINCKPLVMCGGRGTQKILRQRPASEVDVLVSTPGIFSKLMTNKIFTTERLTHIVLDEADTLLDDSFNSLSMRLVQKMKITSEKIESSDEEAAGMQIAFVGATMPTSLADILGDVVPLNTIENVTTTHLHKLMPHVPQKFIKVLPSSKSEELLKMVKSNVNRNIPTLVFCNKSSTANFLGHFLADNSVETVVFHGDMPQKVRDGRFDQLQDGKTNVLIATDIASRGLDTVRVQHVINYDFPHFMSDYIHRVGRVGRVGSEKAGFVVSFVTHKWNVDLLWKIESAARRMTTLHNVNANIKRKLTGLIDKKFHQDGLNEVHL